MLCKPAESAFREGIQEFKNENYMDALVHLEAAIEIDKKYNKKVTQAKYLSFYGLCLSIATDNLKEAIQFCRKAVELEFYNADLFHNLGLVYLLSGNRKDAHQTFIEGLKMQNNHREILLELKKMGVRKKPPLPFLSRNHFLNKISGKIIAALK